MTSSISSSFSAADLPNLPGVRRDISAMNPKLYNQFRASRSTDALPTPGFPDEGLPEEDSLMSYFEDSSKFNKSINPFPSNGSAFNDLSGRYSLVSQRRDRVLKTRSLPYSSFDSLPPFVKQGARVCRFLAYFTEPETSVTEQRSRKVEIKVYLEDSTIEIIEPKIENSGQLQGKFLKRHQVLKPVGRVNEPKSFYTIQDMFAGAILDIYHRYYTIVDCDRATRQYMEEQGLDFGDPLSLPDDIYDPKTRPGLSRATSRCSTMARSRKNGFFEYDRKVLRFYGVWDSRGALFGDIVRVKLHYTLADDMIEIVAMRERNNGRDPMVTLLKKCYVMKKIKPGSPPPHPDVERLSTPAAGAARNPPESTATERPYHWTDLKIGETIAMASLNVLLIDADEFTREFYNTKGMPLEPPISLPEPTYPTGKHVVEYDASVYIYMSIYV
jgi:hypothetical protein